MKEVVLEIVTSKESAYERMIYQEVNPDNGRIHTITKPWFRKSFEVFKENAIISHDGNSFVPSKAFVVKNIKSVTTMFDKHLIQIVADVEFLKNEEKTK